METDSRWTATSKQKLRHTKTNPKGEKRRFIQLIFSLCLFLIVFLGRDAFSAQLESWNEHLTGDTDFGALFAKFGDELAEGETVWSALGSVLDPGSKPTTESPAVQPVDPNIQVMFLSETSRCGLQYVRENSFLKSLRVESSADIPSEPADKPANPVKAKPEIVTAVAQAYGPDGETLPKKVSFQFYELGLNRTVSPVMGTITSEFGYRTGPISGKREFHLAIDIAAAKGTEILAFADGVVRYIGENDSFGLYLMIDHDNGVSTFYAHCSKLLVRKGDPITCGQIVALVGDTGNATGPHLHFTLSKDDIRLNPAYYVEPTKKDQG